MTSTNMFQGLDNAAKPSSRVLRPPGGSSSNLFGGYEEDAAPMRRPTHKTSSIFGPEEPQQVTRRSNPPGGKASGIFGGADDPAPQPRQVAPGRQSSNIFGGADPAPPSKPKDTVIVTTEPELAVSPQLSPVEKEEEEPIPAPPTSPVHEEAAAAATAPLAAPEPAPEATPSCPQDDFGKNHEPHLGPMRRAHNRVLNPPGGKSSVVFY